MTGYRFDVEKLRSSRPLDPLLLIAAILLAGLGFVVLISSSTSFSARVYDDSWYLVRKQAVFAAVGAVLLASAALIDLDLLRRFIKPLVFGTLFLCLLAFLPGIGQAKNGAARWIKLGAFTYQPSELVKLVLPVYLAHLFDKKSAGLDSAASGVLPPTIVTALFCAIVLLQNDFSTAALIGGTALAVFFLAGVRLRHFLGLGLVALPLAALLVFTKEYRLQRLLTFLRPDVDPLGAGFQMRASMDTVAAGGIWGSGIGHGTLKISSVPEIHSDFIFAAFAEETGFIGVVVVFLLFGLFAARGFRAALASGDAFRRLLAFGLVAGLVGQALLNIAVVVGAVPATGIPLPFFSAGGSSLLSTLLAAGLILNVSRAAERAEVSHV